MASPADQSEATGTMQVSTAADQFEVLGAKMQAIERMLEKLVQKTFRVATTTARRSKRDGREVWRTKSQFSRVVSVENL